MCVDEVKWFNVSIILAIRNYREAQTYGPPSYAMASAISLIWVLYEMARVVMASHPGLNNFRHYNYA